MHIIMQLSTSIAIKYKNNKVFSNQCVIAYSIIILYTFLSRRQLVPDRKLYQFYK